MGDLLQGRQSLCFPALFPNMDQQKIGLVSDQLVPERQFQCLRLNRGLTPSKTLFKIKILQANFAQQKTAPL